MNIVRKSLAYSYAGIRKNIQLSCTGTSAESLRHLSVARHVDRVSCHVNASTAPEFTPLSYNVIDVQYRDHSLNKQAAGTA